MKLAEIFKDDKKLKMICIIGIVGIAIIGFTSFLPKEKPKSVLESNDKTAEEYKVQLEKEVMELVTSIKGVGTAKIMITMKNGIEYVYAKEEKQNTDTTNGALGNDQAISQRDNYEQTTIMVEDENGRKTALIKTTIEPTVNGVVIVCEGGDDILIQQQVIDAVKTALGIGSSKVCVSKLDGNN